MPRYEPWLIIQVAITATKEGYVAKKITSSAVDALLADTEEAEAPHAKPTVGSAPPLPKTKAEVNKLNSDQIDAIVASHDLDVGPGAAWFGMSTAEKRSALIAALGLGAKSGVKITSNEIVIQGVDLGVENKPVLVAKKSPLATKSKANDPITAIAQDIESLKDQTLIEQEITDLLANEGMNDFRLGGLLLRLLEEGTFPNSQSFQEYIETRWALKYRKARYMIEMYTGVLKSGVPWDTLQSIGWSKVIALLPVLTQDNASEWVQQAKENNVPTLQAAVKAYLASDQPAGETAVTTVDTFKTLTFKVSFNQEELIKDALEDAMKKGNTEHKGVALELICTEYLGTTLPIKSVVNYDPKAIFTHYLMQAKGDKAAALGMLFTDAFDEVFPGVEVAMTVKE